MKNKFFLTTVLAAAAVLIGCVAQGQNYDCELIPVKKNGKWGYFGTEKMEIMPQFDSVWRFAENGLAKIKLDGKWGYIDKTGKLVIKPNPQFERVGNFANGLAIVKLRGRWGYIDEKGKIVIEPQYEKAWSFTENGLAGVRVAGKWGYINKKGKMIIEPQYDTAGYFKNGLVRVGLNGKYGFIDDTGTNLLNLILTRRQKCFQMTVWLGLN